MVNKVTSFSLRLLTGGSGTRSFPNALEGNQVSLLLPTNQDVLIKNIRWGTYITNAAQTGNSLGEAASGGFFFNARFFMLSNGVFMRNQKGTIIQPGVLPTANGFNGAFADDTLEYSVNYSNPNQLDLNLIANGIQVTQLGYSIPVFAAGQSMNLIVSLEYQDLC